ncbi:MAG: hypothetical protein RQ751_14450, partial [Longimicrobiales bacterium]|nr:hypothetical protein [Longimicrobiales bacterium]
GGLIEVPARRAAGARVAAAGARRRLAPYFSAMAPDPPRSPDSAGPLDLPAIWRMAWQTQRAIYTTRHHGVEHWVRVERNGLWLATRLGEEGVAGSVDTLVVRLFAALHDCQRRDDGYDLEHGPRAADFIGGLRLPLAPERIECLVTAVRTHTAGPTESDDVTVQVCHDADRLDLGRVRIRPSPRFLNTGPAQDLARRDAVHELDRIPQPVTLPDRLRRTPRWDAR